MADRNLGCIMFSINHMSDVFSVRHMILSFVQSLRKDSYSPVNYGKRRLLQEVYFVYHFNKDMVNVLPFPGSLSTSSEPLCC